MVPLAAVPWGVALVVWTTISVLCITALWRTSLPKTFWSFFTQRKRTAVLVALTALSLLLEPVWQTIQFGQINLLLTAMILLDLVRPHERAAARVLARCGDRRQADPAAVPGVAAWSPSSGGRCATPYSGLLATMAIGFAIVPHQSWRYWTDVILDANRVGGLAYTGNQSFNGFLHRLGNEASWVQPTWFVLSAVFGLLVLWLARRYWLADERVTAISVMALAVLYASPVTWSHHWVWIIPLGVSLIRAVNRVWGLNPAVVDRRALLRPVRTALDLVGAVPRRPRAGLDLLAVHPRQLAPDPRHDRLHRPGRHQPKPAHRPTSGQENSRSRPPTV